MRPSTRAEGLQEPLLMIGMWEAWHMLSEQVGHEARLQSARWIAAAVVISTLICAAAAAAAAAVTVTAAAGCGSGGRAGSNSGASEELMRSSIGKRLKHDVLYVPGTWTRAGASRARAVCPPALLGYGVTVAAAAAGAGAVAVFALAATSQPLRQQRGLQRRGRSGGQRQWWNQRWSM